MLLNFGSLGANEYIIYVKEGYLQLHSNGAKDLAYATKVWREVIQQCEKQNISRILGIAYTTKPLTQEEASSLLELAKDLNLDDNYQVAWVELNPDFYDIVLYTEYLLSANGINIRSFYKIEKAREWLQVSGDNSMR